MDEVKEMAGVAPRHETKNDTPLGVTGANVGKNPTRKKIRATITQGKSFEEIQPMRENEKKRVLRLLEGLDYPVSRQEVVCLSGLPINHVTRVVRDLLDEGLIRVCKRDYSRFSGKLVELLAVVERGKE